jgi:hypothetical protein
LAHLRGVWSRHLTFCTKQFEQLYNTKSNGDLTSGHAAIRANWRP